VVLCNCDDPYESNFFKYFALNFNVLGLKKLIATCYDGSPVMGDELMLDFGDFSDEPKKLAYKVEITEVVDVNGDGVVNLADVQYLLKNEKNVLTLLKGSGDFRSSECIELLKEADIVCTNPPFSLFREYVAQLIKYDKKFLIIGNQNALHYKDIFPYIKDYRIWLGHNSPKKFYVPNTFNRKNVIVVGNKKIATFGNIIWYTNLDNPKRHEEVILYKSYQIGEYPRYENFDAIDIDNISNIPYDYDGIMGVPDTILRQLNPKQFEIVGLGSGNLAKDVGVTKNFRGRTDLAYIDKNGKHKSPYSRILIRRKQE